MTAPEAAKVASDAYYLQYYYLMSLDIGVNIAEYNMTNNLLPIWRKIGISDLLYHSDNMPVSEFAPQLREGIKKMVDQYDDLIDLQPINCWGSYESGLIFLIKLYAECLLYPDGIIDSSY